MKALRFIVPLGLFVVLVGFLWVGLSRDPHEFWFPLGDIQVGMPGDRRNVAAVENLITGERYAVEWGGIHVRIDPERDPALLFRCLA